MSARAEMLGDRPIGGEKLLGMARRLKPLHAPLALAGGLVRVLCTVVEIPVLAMFHPWQELSLSRSVALQLIGDQDPWHIHQVLEQLAEKLLRGRLVPAALH
jgi:hypothetical protein